MRIKAFYGCSENAVKTQIWIAIARKLLQLNASLHAMLQVLNLTLFEKTPIANILDRSQPITEIDPSCNQMNLFEF